MTAHSSLAPDQTQPMLRPSVCANIFLIGAQKAGTTFLAALLDQSPFVCVSDPKENHFFTHNYDKGAEFYASCFARPEAEILLDASTTYSFLRARDQMDDPNAPGIADPIPERIAAACPEAKFIYILRDPVKRAASAHRHNRRAKETPAEPVSLMHYMREVNPMLEVASRYADQIERYLEVFPRDRFLFLDFRRVTSETPQVVTEVCAFLGIPPEGITLSDGKRGTHSAHRMTGAGRAIRATLKAVGLEDAVRRALPQVVKSKVVDPIIKAPAGWTFHDEAEVAKLFEADRARIGSLTGIWL